MSTPVRVATAGKPLFTTLGIDQKAKAYEGAALSEYDIQTLEIRRNALAKITKSMNDFSGKHLSESVDHDHTHASHSYNAFFVVGSEMP